MTLTFDVLIMELKAVYDIPEIWTADLYRQLLQAAEFEEIDEIEPADLPDMAVMALQDMKPEKAAETALAVLASDLSSGVRQNLAHEMKEQRMWEQFGNPEHHAAIFATAVFLNRAFPKIYSRPEIARLIVQITASNPAAAEHLGTPTPTLAARLVAAGMDDHSTLHRLYGPQLADGRFPEAASIIWQVQARNQTASAAEWVIYGSWYWLRPLQATRSYSATINTETVPKAH